MQYQNILLIFPAISLLSENYARLCSSDSFQEYKIHSLSEEEFNLSEKNIFIFTPERFLSFMDSHQHLHFDFAFIDEVYKIDNSFIIDQETSGENERDTAYRLALEFICNLTSDMLLAGPYMALPQPNTQQHKSFNNFAEDNRFTFLRYNQFEIVSKEYTTVMTPEQRSRAMSHIKGKDTSIEVLLRKALWHKGIRYRKNYKKLPGTPDIAITKYRIATTCEDDSGGTESNRTPSADQYLAGAECAQRDATQRCQTALGCIESVRNSDKICP